MPSYSSQRHRLHSNLSIWKTKTKNLPDCLARVPENQHRAFLMSRIDNMMHKEIAAKLNITESVVDHSIRNVTKLLSIYMKDYLLFIFLLLFLKAHS